MPKLERVLFAFLSLLSVLLLLLLLLVCCLYCAQHRTNGSSIGVFGTALRGDTKRMLWAVAWSASSLAIHQNMDPRAKWSERSLVSQLTAWLQIRFSGSPPPTPPLLPIPAISPSPAPSRPSICLLTVQVK